MATKNVMITLCVLSVFQIRPDITFGSRDAGIVLDGGMLNLGSTFLSNGTIRDLVGGSVIAPDVSCSQMIVEQYDPERGETKKMVLEGADINLGTSISLGDTDRFILEGGICLESISVNPNSFAVVEGCGSLINPIHVNSNGLLVMRWNGQLDQNIELAVNAGAEFSTDTTTVKLEQDLTFAPGCSIVTQFATPSGGEVVGACNFDGGGYQLSLGGDYTTVTTLPQGLAMYACSLNLTGLLQIPSSTHITFWGDVHVRGNGHTVCFTDASSQWELYSSNPAFFEDVVFSGVGESTFSGESVLQFSRCTFEDYYSALSITGNLVLGDFGIDPFGTGFEFRTDENFSFACIELISDVAFEGCWKFSDDCNLKGNGNVLQFGSSASINFFGEATLVLDSVTLHGLKASSFSKLSNRALFFSNVTIVDTALQAFKITGSENAAAEVVLESGSAAGDLLASNLTFNSKTSIELCSDVTLTGAWLFMDDAVINCNGHKLSVADGSFKVQHGKTLKIENGVLTGFVSNSFSAEVQYQYVQVVGDQLAYSVQTDDSDNTVNVVTTPLSYLNQIYYVGGTPVLDSHGDPVLETIMVSYPDYGTAIIGGVSTQIVTVLPTYNTAYPVTTGGTAQYVKRYDGVFNLSNMTILQGDADVSSYADITVNGPLTIVTGTHTFEANSITVDGVTLVYDTLSDTTNNNVTVTSFLNGGRLYALGSSTSGFETTGTITIASDTALNGNVYLYNQSNGSINSLVINCTQSATLNGYGRSIVFPFSDGNGTSTVLTIANNRQLTTKNVVFEGFVPSQHLSLGNSSSALYLGDRTVMRLHESIALNKTLTFGGYNVNSEEMILDLNGHSLDLNGNQLLLQAPNKKLTIKNGVIKNVTGSLIQAQYNSVISFQDVELMLTGNLTWSSGAVEVLGKFVISGMPGYAFIYKASTAFTLGAQSLFMISDGMIYSHNTSAAFTFANASSQLVLVGGTLRHPDANGYALSLNNGTVIVDHKSTMLPGTYGIHMRSGLNVQIRPSASIMLGVALGIGDETASAGTLYYGD